MNDARDIKCVPCLLHQYFVFLLILSRENVWRKRIQLKNMVKNAYCTLVRKEMGKKTIKRLHKYVINLMTCMRVCMKLNRFQGIFYLLLFLTVQVACLSFALSTTLFTSCCCKCKRVLLLPWHYMP